MATDGIKILDSDLAHDTYSKIIGLFDDFLEREEVMEQIPLILHNYGRDDEYYHELFVNSYALAFWEIGWLNEDILNKVEKVIGIEASVRVWTEEYGANAGKSRRKILDKFWIKINSINLKPRERKKYKQIQEAIFYAEDLLAYKQTNGFYRVIVCARVDLFKGKYSYVFTPTSYFGETIPSQFEIIDCGLYGVRIMVSGDRDSIEQSQNGVSKLWDLFPEASGIMNEGSAFIIGLHQDFVAHKDIINFKEQFIKIGKLKIKEQFKKQGSGSFINNFEDFDNDEQYYLRMKQKAFPIKLICEF